jgi:NAD(P)-dependent dehydrogenase (short-subunit alcohol dehydrogenase family)
LKAEGVTTGQAEPSLRSLELKAEACVCSRCNLDKGAPLSALAILTPRIGEVKEVVDAVLFLTDATFTTGEILHVDGGAHAGKW